MQNSYSKTQKLLQRYLPQRIWLSLDKGNIWDSLEEIRIRAGRPIQLLFHTKDQFLETAHVTLEECEELVLRMCEYSLYAKEEELKCGFLTLQNGIRVGICGRTIIENEKVVRIVDFTSINIRMPREMIGSASGLLQCLPVFSHFVPSVLIFSAPGCGKTTMLRDAARQLSDGENRAKVCIVDERMEIAGCVRGIPQFDVGIRTDVFSGCPKPEGIAMAIRSLSPDVVITDEIGNIYDGKAICDAAKSGVAVWTSAHAASLDDLMQRNVFSDLLHAHAFHFYVLLSRKKGVGTIEMIWDDDLRKVDM